MSDNNELGRVATLACWWCHREIKTVVLSPRMSTTQPTEPMVKLICRGCYAEHLDEFHGESRD